MSLQLAIAKLFEGNLNSQHVDPFRKWHLKLYRIYTLIT